MSQNPLVHVRDLAYRYPGAPGPVFEGLDLTVSEGEFVVLVGGSGVGKSTLLRNIAGLVPPSGGRIDTDHSHERGTRENAFVFQDTRLLPWRSVRANVGYGLAGLGLSRTDKRTRIDEVLELTGLGALGERWPHEISGGQAQRAGLARALAVRPRLLLMDEPFSAVDALTRTRLQDELLSIWRRLRMAVLFVTHDIQEAVYLGDRVAVLRGSPGHIVHDRAVGLAHPRERQGSDFQALASRIADTL